MARYLWLSLVVLLLDQASKVSVLKLFQPYEVLPVLPVFNLTLVFNQGAAFSFLSDAGGWQRWFFILLAAIVALILAVLLARMTRSDRLAAMAYALIIGGALGNLIDRLAYGHVVDFLDFYWQQWHWPAFNVADSAITLAVVLLLWEALVSKSPAGK